MLSSLGELLAHVEDALHDRDPGGRRSTATTYGSDAERREARGRREMTTTRSARLPKPTSPLRPSASALARV